MLFHVSVQWNNLIDYATTILCVACSVLSLEYLKALLQHFYFLK